MKISGTKMKAHHQKSTSKLGVSLLPFRTVVFRGQTSSSEGGCVCMWASLNDVFVINIHIYLCFSICKTGMVSPAHTFRLSASAGALFPPQTL